MHTWCPNSFIFASLERVWSEQNIQSIKDNHRTYKLSDEANWKFAMKQKHTSNNQPKSQPTRNCHERGVCLGECAGMKLINCAANCCSPFAPSLEHKKNFKLKRQIILWYNKVQKILFHSFSPLLSPPSFPLLFLLFFYFL